MKTLRPSLTFANVVSCLALFVALGGSAYAATQLKKNSVGSKQLKSNAVTTAKIKDGAITGSKVQLSTLGTVPSATTATRATTAGNADTLGGTPSSGFLSSTRFLSGAGDLKKKSPQTVLTVPGEFLVTTVGSGANAFEIAFEGLGDEWEFIMPGNSVLYVVKGQRNEASLSGGTALIVASDAADHSKQVVLNCGYEFSGAEVICSAMLSAGT
jgi:hypothetical protein